MSTTKQQVPSDAGAPTVAELQEELRKTRCLLAEKEARCEYLEEALRKLQYEFEVVSGRVDRVETLLDLPEMDSTDAEDSDL